MSGISYSMPRFQAIDQNGFPMFGATLHTYQNKTTTPAPTWRDKEQSAYNTNPIVLDTRGECVVWLDPEQTYTFVLRDWYGGLVWSQDDVVGIASSQDLKAIIGRLADAADPDNGAGMVGYKEKTVSKALDELYAYDSNMPAAYDADSLMSLVSENSVVWIPPGVTIFARDIELPSNFIFVIDGELKMPPGSPDGSVILKNAGDNNIRVVGRGLIDGNKAAQSGENTKHMLVHFVNVDSAEFSVSRCGGNYWPRALPPTPVGAAVFFDKCHNSEIKNSRVDGYAREGFWMLMCDFSKMVNLTAFGGDDSWSGMQFSGSYNQAKNWLSVNAGASSGSFDCQYSSIDGWTGINNRFTNTINFGHQGFPASHSEASNLIAIGGSQEGTTNVMHGVNIGGSTVGLRISSIQVSKSVNNGLNISDGSTDVSVDGATIRDCGGYAVSAFSNAANIYDVFNLRESGNSLGSIRATGSAIIRLNDSVLSAAPSWATPATVRLRNTPVGGGAQSGGVSIAGSAPESPVTVTNPTVRSTSTIILQNANSAAESAEPFVSSINDGSFVITPQRSAGGGAFCRYTIL